MCGAIWRSSLNAIAPEDFPYVHTLEGPDDMPAHVKASLMGSSVSIPVSDGTPAAGHVAGHLLVRAPRPMAAAGRWCSRCGASKRLLHGTLVTARPAGYNPSDSAGNADPIQADLESAIHQRGSP